MRFIKRTERAAAGGLVALFAVGHVLAIGQNSEKIVFSTNLSNVPGKD